MDLNSLLGDLAEAVASDSDTLTWANSTYGRDHKVYVNVDVRNPPGEDDCPFVALYPLSKSVGRAVSRKEHGFEVVCCVHDSALKSHALTNLVEYEGVRRVETFRKYVETAIAGVSVGNALLELVEVEYETIDQFPFILSVMVIQIGEEVTIGSNPLT